MFCCQARLARQGPWCRGGRCCSKRLAERLRLPGRLCCWLHAVGAKKTQSGLKRPHEPPAHWCPAIGGCQPGRGTLEHRRTGDLHQGGFIGPGSRSAGEDDSEATGWFFLPQTRRRFHGCSQLGGQGAGGQGCWSSAEQPTAPERHLRTRLFNSRRSSIRSSEIGPAGGFIHFSFPLPPARGCAKIPCRSHLTKAEGGLVVKWFSRHRRV